jgi:hypothetical protein
MRVSVAEWLSTACAEISAFACVRSQRIVTVSLSYIVDQLSIGYRACVSCISLGYYGNWADGRLLRTWRYLVGERVGQMQRPPPEGPLGLQQRTTMPSQARIHIR